MTELLTESFCERCGTRYELGAPQPMTRTRKTRGLVTGLKSFIMSTESLSDSINDAMRAEEDALATRQIEAFQDTFNFCLDCRRYTCVSCWNDDEGRCRSCMPVAGVDDVGALDERMTGPALMPSLVDEVPQLTMAEEPAWPAAEPLGATAEPVNPELTWPAEDEIVVPTAASAPPADWPVEPEPVLAQADAAAAAEEADLAAATEVVPEAWPVEAEEPAVVLAEAETTVTPEVEPDVVSAEVVEEELEVAAAAELEIEPEPAAPTPLPVPPAPRRDLRDTFLRGPLVPPRPAPPPEQLAARQSQLDILGIEDPGEGTVSVGERSALPYRSSGAGSNAMLAAVWDASTRALEANAQRAALRPCDSCGLTVSSTARFCRRCGAPQTLSA